MAYQIRFYRQNTCLFSLKCRKYKFLYSYLGFRIPFLKNLYEKTNSDILFVAYRGYSDSDGVPTEQGLQLDAQAILSYAISYRAK